MKHYVYSIRTNPKDIKRVIDWMPFYAKYNGHYNLRKLNQYQYPCMNWSNNHYIHPYRRLAIFDYYSYIYNHYNVIKSNYQFITGSKHDFAFKGKQIGDGKIAHSDKEGIFRNYVASAKKIGLLKSNGSITPVGKLASKWNFTSDDLIIQLLEERRKVDSHSICPFQILLYMINKFHKLSLLELAPLFSVTQYTPYYLHRAVNMIIQYRKHINNRPKLVFARPLMKSIYEQVLGFHLTASQSHSILVDYPQALQYLACDTDLFFKSGRGYFSTLHIKNIHHFNLLMSNFNSLFPYHISRTTFYDVKNILPWKLSFNKYYQKSVTNETRPIMHKLHNLNQNYSSKMSLFSKLKQFMGKSNLVNAPNRFEFLHWECFDALSSHFTTLWGGRLQQDKYSQYHLLVLNHTPGRYADVCIKGKHFINAIEVSLTNGMQQAKSEVVPVIKHLRTLNHKYVHKRCFGVFIAPSIDSKTFSHFILSTCADGIFFEPVIPLSLSQEISIFTVMVRKHLTMLNFNHLLAKIVNVVRLNFVNYQNNSSCLTILKHKINNVIKKWLQQEIHGKNV